MSYQHASPAQDSPALSAAPALGSPSETPLQDAGGGGNAFLASLLGCLPQLDPEAPRRSRLPVADEVPSDDWDLFGLPLHRQYKPLGDIDRLEYSDGSEERRYDTSTGASFEASLDADDYTTGIRGTGLHLKSQLGIAGRGYTSDAVGKVAGAGQHSSHLIADQFTGSGYKEGGNLIATSGAFNLGEMSDAEDLIRAAVEENGAESFDMDVAVDWGAMDDPTVIAGRVDQAVAAALEEDPTLSEEALAQLREDEESRLRDNLAAFEERFGDDMKRCMGVRYNVTLHLPDGTEVAMDEIGLGPDQYMGFDDPELSAVDAEGELEGEAQGEGEGPDESDWVSPPWF